jgi:RimJ/RimL family protein N-acetyltransferase
MSRLTGANLASPAARHMDDVCAVPIPSNAWVKSLHLAARRVPAAAEEVDVGGLRVTLRPMRAGDERLHEAFVARLDADDLRSRFGREIGTLRREEFARRTRVDPDRESAFVAIAAREGGEPEIVGEVRAQADPYGGRWEFGIVVSSAHHRLGLGRLLLGRLVDCARARNVRLLYGLVNASNAAMIGLARRLGFDVDEVPGSGTVIVSLDVAATAPASVARGRGRPAANVAGTARR